MQQQQQSADPSALLIRLIAAETERSVCLCCFNATTLPLARICGRSSLDVIVKAYY